MLLCLVAHLFVTKLRTEYSCKPQSPGPAPYIDEPVSLDDYLEAAVDMIYADEIEHPNILAVPTILQQVMTIGLVRTLIEATFVKFGAVLEDINYRIQSAAQAFESHTRRTLDLAFSGVFALASNSG
jgi:hypothetical protein